MIMTEWDEMITTVWDEMIVGDETMLWCWMRKIGWDEAMCHLLRADYEIDQTPQILGQIPFHAAC